VSLDNENPEQSSLCVSLTTVKYYDIEGKIVKPHASNKKMIFEYDDVGNRIRTTAVFSVYGFPEEE
jgi:predicted site-specific integrase-resolvase